MRLSNTPRNMLTGLRLLAAAGCTGLLLACSDGSSVSVENEAPATGVVTSEKADITGRVLDITGRPIAGATVVTTPYGRTLASAPNRRRIVEEFFTDAEGRYTIPQHPLGSYALKAMASGYVLSTKAVGNTAFNPQNMVNGRIQRDFALAEFPARNDGDTPPIALFDSEDKKRMTELLTVNGLRYENIAGKMNTLSRARHRVLVIGLDATVYFSVQELSDNGPGIAQFIAEGGHVYLGQLNDFSYEGRPLDFLPGELGFVLHTEEAPFNDFQSGIVRDAGHPLARGVSFSNWRFIEPGQNVEKQNVTFDAAVRASFQGPRWNIIATAPAVPFSNGAGTVDAEADVIIAEYTDPQSRGRLIVNQGAYFQASSGDLTDPNAQQLTANVIAYLKALNRGE